MLTLSEKLQQGCEKRTLVMLDTYPFFVIGTLCNVSEHYVEIDVKFGVPSELIHLPFRIMIDDIVAIYAETYEGEIPYPDNFRTRKEKAGGGTNDTTISDRGNSSTNSV